MNQHNKILYLLPDYLGDYIKLSIDGEYDDEMKAMPTPMQPMDSPIVVIPIFGILTKYTSTEGTVNYEVIADILDYYVNDPNTQVIILHFNSPGGQAIGVPELANKVNKLTQVKPIIAWVDEVCGSAAYMLASQCDMILSSLTAKVGGIGAIRTLYDLSKMNESAGVSKKVYKSRPYKDMGDTDRPTTEDEDKLFLKEIVDADKAFVEIVRKKRNIKDEDITGLTYTGQEAIDKGYVDKTNVNFIEDVVESLLTPQ